MEIVSLVLCLCCLWKETVAISFRCGQKHVVDSFESNGFSFPRFSKSLICGNRKSSSVISSIVDAGDRSRESIKATTFVRTTTVEYQLCGRDAAIGQTYKVIRNHLKLQILEPQNGFLAYQLQMEGDTSRSGLFLALSTSSNNEGGRHVPL